MNVDTDRLREDLEANGAIGALDVTGGRGRTVLCGSDANRRARDRLVDRFEDAGLAVRIDAVGNVVGRWTPERADPDRPPVAAGSHLDSVRAGGIFDGPLGVYGALEAVRVVQESDRTPARPIEVVCFTEEEGGRFGPGLLGSSVAAGVRPVDEALALTDDDGITLADALADMGYRGQDRVNAAGWEAWIELHIEQADRLETQGVPVGIVTTIAGITHAEVTVDGEANHAGATPMADRTDALTAAAQFVLDVEAVAHQVHADRRGEAVGTVGRIAVEPNATNVVPGRVTLGVDVRDVTADGMAAVLDGAEDSLDRLAADRGVETAIGRELEVAPMPLNDRVRAATSRAAERSGLGSMTLHSGAAHDSMHVASVTDAGMLFAPSRRGVSHSPHEWTDWGDCAAATQVLAGALADLAGTT